MPRCAVSPSRGLVGDHISLGDDDKKEKKKRDGEFWGRRL